MPELSPEVPVLQPQADLAEQSKGVWAIGWLTILWSGFTLFWVALLAGLLAVSRHPSFAGWGAEYGLESLAGQPEYLLSVAATAAAAGVYFVTAIGWLRARGWAHRAMLHCAVAKILAIQTAVLLDASQNGLSAWKLLEEFSVIVPAWVWIYAARRRVRAQFCSGGSGAVAVALGAALVVYAASAGLSAKRWMDDRRLDAAAEQVQLTVSDRLPEQEARGRYVILHFWASWCGPCRALLPELKALQTHAAARSDVRMIGVSLDTSRPAMERFAKRHGMTWPQVFDGKGWSAALGKQYGVRSIPYEILLGPGGAVLLDHAAIKDLEEQLKTLPPAEEFKSASNPAAAEEPKPVAPSPQAAPVAPPTPPAADVPQVGGIRGPITYLDMSASAVAPTPPSVVLWKLADRGGRLPFVPRIENDTYEFTDVPVGKYQVLVTLDANSANPPGFAGDYAASPSVLNMTPGGVVEQPAMLQQLIHMTQPADNLQRFERSAQDPLPVHPSPVAVAWEPVFGATHYIVDIYALKSGKHMAGDAEGGHTTATHASFSLPVLADGEGYRLRITAYKHQTVIGTLETFGKNYRAWDYAFRVAEP